MSPEDEALMQQFAEEEIRVEEERAKSKVIQENLDREKRVLEQAQKIAEQNAAEAAL